MADGSRSNLGIPESVRSRNCSVVGWDWEGAPGVGYPSSRQAEVAGTGPTPVVGTGRRAGRIGVEYASPSFYMRQTLGDFWRFKCRGGTRSFCGMIISSDQEFV